MQILLDWLVIVARLFHFPEGWHVNPSYILLSLWCDHGLELVKPITKARPND